jgi:glyoxylase-like metal-dependent hydrolase (beta-lactamase superfamily II)
VSARTFEIARGVHWLPVRGANVYFVRSGESWVLIDAGYRSSARAIAEAAARLCGAAGRPELILLTHGHPDHAGAAVGLAAAWDLPIILAEDEMPFVNGTALYPEPLVHFMARVMPRRVMEALVRGSDLGAAIRSFDPQADVPDLPDWIAVPTPGHTPGHVAFFRRGDRTLLTGDAVLTLAWSSRLGGGGAGWLWDLARCRPRLSGPPTVVTCDWREAAASIVGLAELDPWVLATGHGIPLAGRQVAPALRAFAARVAASPPD